MRTKLFMLISVGLAILLGCVDTTGVDAPSQIDPNTTFECTVNTIGDSLNPGAPDIGYLAILIPEIWSVDSVYGEGYGFTGSMDSIPNVQTYPNYTDPPVGYEWSMWETPVPLTSYPGDSGYAIVNINTSDSLGEFQLVFYTGSAGSIEPIWEDTPCSCTVEVTPLNLQQDTWAHIKSDLAQ